MAVRSLLKTLALLLVALLFLSVVVAATDEPAAAAADTPEPAAAAEADHDEAATPKPKPPPLVLPALKPQKELPKRFVFTEVEGELGTRHFEGAYLLPKKAGKVTVSFNSPRRAALKLKLGSKTKCQVDIVINGILSSSFGGVGYNLEQIVPKGNSEVTFMFSRMDAVKLWYARNKNFSVDDEPDEEDEEEDAENGDSTRDKYPPHMIVSATLDFNKDVISALADKIQRQKESAVKRDIGGSGEL